MRDYWSVLYNIGWVIGFWLVLMLVDNLEGRIQTVVGKTYTAEWLLLLVPLYMLVGVYIALCVVDVRRFKFKAMFFFSACLPLSLVLIAAEPLFLGFQLITYQWLPHISAAIGFTLMMSLFQTRKVFRD
ncbi:hypothetical protein [Paenibacillus chungangensis]|uniref:Uncharacterized protein n=1 Tax=Paenibacillus chungangensis TaxID=696535 RepID=A0ABW3HRU0_9BACL